MSCTKIVVLTVGAPVVWAQLGDEVSPNGRIFLDKMRKLHGKGEMNVHTAGEELPLGGNMVALIRDNKPLLSKWEGPGSEPEDWEDTLMVNSRYLNPA